MPEDRSIYEIDYIIGKNFAINQMEVMKIIMVKGIGYIAIPHNKVLNADVLLELAISMEDRNIKL